jgi:aspartate kinase
VADHVARTRRQGADVVVVVSAMGKTTDDLLRLAGEVSSVQPPRELDMLLTSGERVSMALLCMALAGLGVDAVSYTGSQAGIITDTTHGKAKIVEIKADRLRAALDEGRVPVVAGFQGVSLDRDVTTLGRGGSDTTAVALAAALGAEACEIYTDVSGVFSADPRIVPEARRLARVSFEEMLDIAASGGRVLALRSVEFARNHSVPLHVRSSFTWEPGTWVVEEDASMEQAVVTAVTHDTSEAKVTVTGVPDRPGIAARLFRALADGAVNVDTIVQNTSLHGTTDISFTVPKTDLALSMDVARALAPEIGAGEVTADDAIAKVSLVGAGMRSHPGVSATMFEVLADAAINIEMISTSSIRLSCVVRAERVEEAVRLLHQAFELSGP